MSDFRKFSLGWVIACVFTLKFSDFSGVQKLIAGAIAGTLFGCLTVVVFGRGAQ